MTNRDRYFNKLDTYDLLVRLNVDMVLEADKNPDAKCIIERITGKEIIEDHYFDNEILYSMRCIHNNRKNCEQCIQRWLNEETK